MLQFPLFLYFTSLQVSPFGPHLTHLCLLHIFLDLLLFSFTYSSIVLQLSLAFFHLYY